MYSYTSSHHTCKCRAGLFKSSKVISKCSPTCLSAHVPHTCSTMLCILLVTSQPPAFSSSLYMYVHGNCTSVGEGLAQYQRICTVSEYNVPICDSIRGVVTRSHRGESGSASSFSQSPCRKNSSVILAVHWECVSHGLPGCEMSAVCSSRHSALERCSSSSWHVLR